MNFLKDYFSIQKQEEEQEILNLEREIDRTLSKSTNAITDILIENKDRRRTHEVLNAYRKHGWHISKAEETREGIKYHFKRDGQY